VWNNAWDNEREPVTFMGQTQFYPQSMRKMLGRISQKFRRTASVYFHRRMVPIKSTNPIISFSFDDAPRTAFSHGGDILKSHGAKGTYFVSLGLLGSMSPSGTIASHLDLLHAVEEGHELGCHTFDHRDPSKTALHLFETSVQKNRQALETLLPGNSFASFAFPLSEPRPATKQRIGNLFKCCRGGGQAFNCGSVDLNLLKAFFIDSRIRASIDSVMRLIDRNAKCGGWLVFATHDVDDHPSPYGCTTEYFKTLVAYAASSGSLILPVGEACEQIQAS
jgi:hypothetical protein